MSAPASQRGQRLHVAVRRVAGTSQGALQPGAFARNQTIAAPWYDDVVQPLRAIRIRWRDTAADDVELKAFREQVKRLELEAERTLLSRLETLTQDWSVGVSQDVMAWLEGLAADAAQENRDALQVLRVAANQA